MLRLMARPPMTIEEGSAVSPSMQIAAWHRNEMYPNFPLIPLVYLHRSLNVTSPSRHHHGRTRSRCQRHRCCRPLREGRDAVPPLLQGGRRRPSRHPASPQPGQPSGTAVRAAQRLVEGNKGKPLFISQGLGISCRDCIVDLERLEKTLGRDPHAPVCVI
ncbi:uncharacterized protein B0I36DRAFT_400643 [Microdochium trichocladiopsis]|uniref:Uncharacterized protein n=1 Tax=Microdochium trichocladiopsis TaxID=1682393 RepID=A0A9P8XRR1_9PEZI|nr:uncharacterized protein B0I36DRAFT_401190 [Microdochium trichocladiopsis]XP_046004293.1 uncharacterized protein B0I36DRAFT_400643 [Microdochium trichocladiopsis]KAH7010601.1 hypothetical protein B0I36DRAFT_401190 [Microdochium trichocladiopsis]KAH7010808.1 hypothetical protein B0I36DRAFT_400643 [Microdochium trichocladiopsis]